MDRNLRIRMLLQAGDKVTKPLRDIAGGSTKAAQSLKATRDRLKEIERAQAELAGFRELKAGLRTTEQASAAARTKVAQLAREMDAAEKPTRQLARDFAKAKQEAAALGRQHEQETRELQRMRDRLDAAGISTRRLVAHERQLREGAARTTREIEEQARALARADDRARRFAAGRASFDRVQGRAAGLAAGGAAAIGTGIAAAAPVVGSVRAAQNYQSVMTDIAQKANLSREEARKMGLVLLANAKAANQLPAALQAGVDTLSGFGLDPRQAVAMMRPIGRAATAYKAEIADLSAAAFAANDNLKVPVGQTARVIDIMAAAGKSGAFEIKDMAGQFPALTAAYQALGQAGPRAIADLAAGAQIARKGAGDSATAGNNLLNLLNKINAKETNDNFKKFGVDLPAALKKAAKEGRSPIEAIAEMTSKALKGDTSKLSYLFGDAQVQAAMRPLLANLQEFRRIRDDALGASGTTDLDFAERMRDSAEQTRQLQINAQVLGVTLGTALLPTVNRVVQKATAFAGWVGRLAAAHPRLAKAVGVGAAGFAALLVVLGVAGIAVAGIMGPIAILNAGLIALGVTGGVASVGLLPIIGTVAAIVAGVALLAGGAYLIYNNWGAIAGFFASIWSAVRGFFAGGVGGILQALAGLAGMAVGLLLRFGISAFGFLTGTLPGMLASGFGVAFGVLKATIVAAFTTLPRMMFDFGVFIIRGLVSGIRSAPGTIWSAAKGLASSFAAGFKKAAGINSPSRVFMGFGGYITEGLALGVDQGAGAPIGRVQRLSREVAAAMAIGAAAPAVAVGAGPGGAAARGPAGTSASVAAPAPIIIQVYGAPGQAPQDLARAVADELDRRERASAATARAAFRDQPDWSDRA